MPLHGEAERRWAYYVPQPIPEGAVTSAPSSVRDLKLIDPAVGSGHFLVVAFELLVALYREEAQHRGSVGAPEWTDRAIVERILEHNLHGIDLDPRAVQIAAAALWLKAKAVCPEARPRRLNLVAANLRLSSLPDDDPALLELRHEVERETGIPASLTDTIIGALKGADHLGSLLKIDSTVDEALGELEGKLGRSEGVQGHLTEGFPEQQMRLTMTADAAKESLLSRLEGFLAKRTSGDDLGLRLRGQQLAAGVRFLRMVKEGGYDLVVANPPYQGTSKMEQSKYVEKQYPLGKADLYAAFLLRGLELVREGGVSAMLTMRNWMFIKQYAGLRERFLESFDLRAIGDFEIGAFEEVGGMVVSVCVSVLYKMQPCRQSVALKLTLDPDEANSGRRTHRKRAATLCHVGRHDFDPAALKVVPEWPLVYWWNREIFKLYAEFPLMGERYRISAGVKTGDDPRFLRRVWEVRAADLPHFDERAPTARWQYYVKGAEGAEWFEPGLLAIEWGRRALTLGVYGMYCSPGTVRLRDPALYYKRGVAFSPIGQRFSAREYRCVRARARITPAFPV